MQRLIATLKSGVIINPDPVGAAGQRRLGYLAEVTISLSVPREVELKLRFAITRLRATIGPVWEYDDARGGDPYWLPEGMAGSDERASSWGLAIGLSAEFRQSLAQLSLVDPSDDPET